MVVADEVAHTVRQKNGEPLFELWVEVMALFNDVGQANEDVAEVAGFSEKAIDGLSLYHPWL
eukprot:JP439209.1.p3 GENE.JP439209.1~~JP439209.1.p3  ORF type:complete len:62 (+),score=15.26 JP439209.1:1-186(+)